MRKISQVLFSTSVELVFQSQSLANSTLERENGVFFKPYLHGVFDFKKRIHAVKVLKYLTNWFSGSPSNHGLVRCWNWWVAVFDEWNEWDLIIVSVHKCFHEDQENEAITVGGMDFGAKEMRKVIPITSKPSHFFKTLQLIRCFEKIHAANFSSFHDSKNNFHTSQRKGFSSQVPRLAEERHWWLSSPSYQGNSRWLSRCSCC